MELEPSKKQRNDFRVDERNGNYEKLENHLKQSISIQSTSIKITYYYRNKDIN